MLSALLLAVLASRASARAFLDAPSNSRGVTTDAVEFTMLADLASSTNFARLEALKDVLRPTFTSLPKNEKGRLEPPSVRYALHRHFVQKYGWYVKGLDPTDEAWNASSPVGAVKDKLPAYIYGQLEKQLHHSGLDLGELASFAATLTDLIDQEIMPNLLRVYDLMGWPIKGLLTGQQLDDAVVAYLVLHLEGHDSEVKTLQELIDLEDALEKASGAGLSDYFSFIDDLRRTSDLREAPRRNPFKQFSGYRFDEAFELVREFTHKFSTVTHLECAEIKGKMVDFEQEGTGRVRLSDFYLRSAIRFKESPTYLRALGAIDETSPFGPSVMIPSYVTSPSNCISDSMFFSSCCYDECEGLLGHLERQIAAPSARPQEIARLVAALPSDTVEAPRNLSEVLVSRLGEIAMIHNGEVPLHGRLFLQWMHHAYPRECAFPHELGTREHLTQSEFMERHQTGTPLVTDDQIRDFVMEDGRPPKPANLTLEAKMEALPWSSVEQLVSVHKVGTKGSTAWTTCLRSLGALAALASFVFALLPKSKADVVSSSGAFKSHLV